MGSLYNRVKVNNPGHSFFNMSFDKKFDCDAGQLIPIIAKFCMPNDVIKFGNEIVARMNPLVAPVMHEVNIYTQYFFVPFRIMFGQMKYHNYPSPTGTETVAEWEVNDRDFETFLTGGKTGFDTSVSLPTVNVDSDVVTFNDNYVHEVKYDADTESYSNAYKVSAGETPPPNSACVRRVEGGDLWRRTSGIALLNDVWIPYYQNEVVPTRGPYSLWDYLDFPVEDFSSLPTLAFPFMAYSLVWNNFFRDQQLMDEINVRNNSKLMNVCWNKDYFTAAYTDLQRGQSPALPLSNSLLPVFLDKAGYVDKLGVGSIASGVSVNVGVRVDSDNSAVAYKLSDGSSLSSFPDADPFVVDASGLFNVNDLRLAMRVQEWLETNQRVGTHLNEFLVGHFGIGPHDETLQRPVYLGGSKSPVIVSEVLQTSQTTEDSGDTKGSPQGNMAGHGITADRNFIGSYHCKEFGVFLGVLYIRPKATYQQGTEREWLYQTKYDFPYPEFAHLGNQAIFTDELFSDYAYGADADGNPRIFAYTERYNELRSSHSRVCGGLRSQLNFWHLGRKFDDVPEFNADFVRCVPSKRIFAVETEPGFIVNVGNICHMYRPLPLFGEPRT